MPSFQHKRKLLLNSSHHAIILRSPKIKERLQYGATVQRGVLTKGEDVTSVR